MNNDFEPQINDRDEENEDAKRKHMIEATFFAVLLLLIGALFLIRGLGNEKNKGNGPRIDNVLTNESGGDADSEAIPDTEEEDSETLPESEEKTTEEETTAEPIKVEYTYTTDISAYLEYIDTKDEQYIRLVNRDNPMDKSEMPTDLVKLKSFTSYKMRTVAAKAFEAMHLEMKAEGIKDIKVISTYRSYDQQVSLYTGYTAKEKKNHPTYSDEEIAAIVNKYSAIPGTSEHHTGLCFDFGPDTEAFAGTPLYAWMLENAHKFGFILRYPEGRDDITGYKYEPWQWRFVGREAATYIYLNDLTLEEYHDTLNK